LKSDSGIFILFTGLNNTMKRSISFMTFNVQGVPSQSNATLRRLEIVAEKLNLVDVDIINIQEIFTTKQLDLLKFAMTNFPFCSFSKGLIGPKGGLVTISKIPFIREEYYPFSLVDLFKAKLFKVFRKNLLSGKGILVTETVGGYTILNTHLIANPKNDWHSLNDFLFYRRQFSRIRQIIKIQNNEKVVIVSGDLNIPKNSDLYFEMLKFFEITDVFLGDDFPTFHKEFLNNGELGHRFDYIFINESRRVKVMKKKYLYTKRELPASINKGFLSDHIALYVNVVVQD
jgi:exonuclease III